MYCAWRIPAHLRCTQCSILLHLMDICFLTCICLWQISQILTFLFKVVGPGLVSTSPAFVSSSASHPAGPHGRYAQKTVNRAPIDGGPILTDGAKHLPRGAQRQSGGHSGVQAHGKSRSPNIQNYTLVRHDRRQGPGGVLLFLFISQSASLASHCQQRRRMTPT